MYIRFYAVPYEVLLVFHSLYRCHPWAASLPPGRSYASNELILMKIHGGSKVRRKVLGFKIYTSMLLTAINIYVYHAVVLGQSLLNGIADDQSSQPIEA